MKNEEHESVKNTLKKNKTLKTHGNNKSKAMHMLNIELRGLMQEIKNSNLIYRHMIDFEKSFFKENATNIEHIKYTNKRPGYTESKEIDLDKFCDTFEAIHKNNNVLNEQFLRYTEKNDELHDSAQNIHEFYVSAYNIPLWYILENSRKVVFTRDVIFAKNEMRVVKNIKNFKDIKTKDKLNISSDVVIDYDIQFEAFKKIVCKILAKSCKKMLDKSTLHIEGEKYLFIENFNTIKQEEYQERNRVEYVKKHLDIFEMINLNKSSVRFTVQTSKKINTPHHTSHLNTIRRILPEINRIHDPCGIVEYKTKMKIKNVGPVYRREIPNGGKGYIAENVTYNVRPDLKRR